MYIEKKAPVAEEGPSTTRAQNHISIFYLMDEPVVKCGDDVFLKMAPAVRRERKKRDIRRGLEARLIC